MRQYTNFSCVLNIVRNTEAAELREAVSERGGKVTFPGDQPVSVEFYGGSGPCSGTVQAVRIEDDELYIEVCDDRSEVFDIGAGDLYPGAAQPIFEAIGLEAYKEF